MNSGDEPVRGGDPAASELAPTAPGSTSTPGTSVCGRAPGVGGENFPDRSSTLSACEVAIAAGRTAQQAFSSTTGAPSWEWPDGQQHDDRSTPSCAHS